MTSVIGIGWERPIGGGDWKGIGGGRWHWRLGLIAGLAACGAACGVATAGLEELELDEAMTVSTTFGGSASKGKLVRLVYPQGEGFEKVLVVVYADAAGGEVWDFKGEPMPANDIFAVRSTDGGATWSEPVNLSGTAGEFSAECDHDGLEETPPRPYWGHSQKPNIFSLGKNVLVSWVDHYAPTGVQRTVRYPDVGLVEVPYAATYVARSTDGGLTWSAAERLTDGYRDAKQDVNRGSSAGWMITWQEDPQGLQPGEAEGPGEGGSGAKVSKGTDIWGTSLPTAAFLAGESFPEPRRLTDNFTQMGSGSNEGYEYGQHGASRANLGLMGGMAILAYEETKGLEGLDIGKYVRYHVFSAFDDSMPDATDGAGWIISQPDENARRVRFVQQGTPGPQSGIRFLIFFKQGLYDQGGPSDIVVRRGIGGFLPEHLDPPVAENPTTREAAFGNSYGLNVSSSAGLGAISEDDDLEDALAHRAVLIGDFIAMGYSWTPDWAVARFTDLEHYDFFVRRSFDGGATWDEPRNMTAFPDSTVNAKEPRIVKTAPSPDPDEPHDPSVFFVAWGTELNQYEHQAEAPMPLDLFITRTADLGETYSPPVAFAAAPEVAEFESQIRSTADGSEFYMVWQSTVDGFTTTDFRAGVAVDPTQNPDINGDGVVDGADLAELIGAWGVCPKKGVPCRADLDGSGMVDGTDLSILIGAWSSP